MEVIEATHIGIEIDHLSDIWACGVLMHRLICGRHPLHPLDGNQLVVTAMLELPMPSMAEAAPPDCPRELVQIVDRCLLKAKEQRWQSATELLKAILFMVPTLWFMRKRDEKRSGSVLLVTPA